MRLLNKAARKLQWKPAHQRWWQASPARRPSRPHALLSETLCTPRVCTVVLAERLDTGDDAPRPGHGPSRGRAPCEESCSLEMDQTVAHPPPRNSRGLCLGPHLGKG